MGVLSKLAFWKKKDDFGDIGKDLGLDKELGMDAGPSPDLGMGLDAPSMPEPMQKYPSFQQQMPSFSQPAYQPPVQSSVSNDSYINSKNLEIISSKLDALRASMDSMSQRLANIEAIARGEQEDSKKRRYY